ncbi:uncharacterized protein [Diabrotica undecimpunctata]|uniref:uncharacterized protein n=1 Tax=Diabrotica undecimpunctata TaxID=50387 RepID=UPI003B640F10
MNTEEQIKIVKRKRGAVKAKLTHFKNFLNDLETETRSEIHILEDAIYNLNLRIEEANKIIQNYEESQLELENLVDEDELETCYTEREEFTKSFYCELARSKRLQSKLSRHSTDLSNNSSYSENASGSQVNDFNGFRLPPVEVPKFSGSHEDWLEFHETFSSLIHTNSALRNFQKFHYLKSSLSACASEVIASIEFSEANYIVAWNLLCERYNNERLLVHNHVKALLNLDVKTCESSKILRFLIDSISKHLKALKQLNQPTEHWDTLIIYIVTSKLDNKTAREWEEFRSKMQYPTVRDLKTFLKSKADLLETIESKRDTSSGNTSSFHRKQSRISQSFVNTENVSLRNNNTADRSGNNMTCAFCKQNHYIRNCAEFLKLSPAERNTHAKRLRLCINCLRPGHINTVCRLSNCRKCNGRHNTLLHIQNNEYNRRENNTTENPNVSLTCSNISQENVLLATALVQVIDKFNKPHTVRALLDSGSQSSFISLNLCDILNLETENINMAVVGLNSSKSHIRKKCEISVESLHSAYSVKLSCLIINEITGIQPTTVVNINRLNIPKNIILADPEFYKPGPIDLLIGANLFWNLMQIGQIRLGSDQPVLQKTSFGWIISGNITENSNVSHCNLSLNGDIQKQLEKFWLLEECCVKPAISEEEASCEQHFIENTKRDVETGRFVVSIPFKTGTDELGDSEEQARRRFLSLERKLKHNSDLRKKYVDFMNEYKALGHMTKVNKLNTNAIHYYLPHHGVLREESVTTKLRVVFDASAATSTGLSLNDLQMVGPTIQSSLLSILLRFRIHAFVITADIEKMYRQVMINPKERSLQRIFWRSNPNEELEIYELNTVTYGTASAPFLAIRCIMELALNCEGNSPDLSQIIKNDIYVDDLITGADSIQEAVSLGVGISKILSEGCFKLRKWHSNSDTILQIIKGDVPSQKTNSPVQFSEGQNTKTLGLGWSCDSDSLTFKIEPNAIDGRVTKRIILSAVGQIFDPLGLLAPCIIKTKIILQRLWLERLSWDESVPQPLHGEWLKFKSEIPKLNSLIIPRHVTLPNVRSIELHGFSDASERAYGACIYVRSITRNNQVSVRLLCAKSKVSPLKTITIPKLELCAAVVLSKLCTIVKDALNNTTFERVTLWTDSTIVLGWLKTEPHRLKTFTSNRVAEVQTLTSSCDWRHVSSKDNPADLVSRGISPYELEVSNLWWSGPSWLNKSECDWPQEVKCPENLPELKCASNSFLIRALEPVVDISRFSSLSKLIRTVAFVLRFVSMISNKDSRRTIGPLNTEELRKAYKLLLKMSQRESYTVEINNLLNRQEINTKSKILNLNPFIDQEGLLRVGGRLTNSDYSYDKKHPIIVSAHNPLTKLIFKSEHLKLMHAGPQLLLSSLRQSIWPVSGRNLAKLTVRQCVTCFRFNAKNTNPIMGNLPKTRFDAGYPFKVCGVDYGGPFIIKNRYGRGSKTSKCYMALFVGFAVKAVHIELVSDLSTDTFLLALKRFISRRGKPQQIYSDNGTNFVGANHELQALSKFLISNQNKILELCSSENINWHFIPAHSPHFGGLWEAGIKSSKNHLKRVVGNNILTFEELSTVFAQIEAILNSRPLSPLSSDPNDENPLTPAHFLIGKPLIATPEPDITDLPTGRLSRFQLLEQMRQNFWRRWSKEYISELQQRVKWKKTQRTLSQGSMVLVKEDNINPLKWRLGRVLELHPGKDGICRVASIRTATGVIRRAFPKICPLPIQD